MSRPRKPTETLAAAGAFKKNPKRAEARVGEPKPKTPIGPKPAGLPPEAAICWDRLVELCPKGVLKDCDEPIVELTSRLWAKVKNGEATAAEQTQLKACLQQLGMTPASRSNVHVAKEEAGNQFANV